MNVQGSNNESGSSESQKRQRVDGANNQTEEKFVVLNVGGTKFSTSKTTLLTEPESMLGGMFSGRHLLVPTSSDGR